MLEQPGETAARLLRGHGKARPEGREIKMPDAVGLAGEQPAAQDLSCLVLAAQQHHAVAASGQGQPVRQVGLCPGAHGERQQALGLHLLEKGRAAALVQALPVDQFHQRVPF